MVMVLKCWCEQGRHQPWLPWLPPPLHRHTDTPHKFCRVLFAAKQDEGFHTAQILVQGLRAE